MKTKQHKPTTIKGYVHWSHTEANENVFHNQPRIIKWS